MRMMLVKMVYSVDFCWMHTYQMADTFSDVCINETAEQAYRAGFREGTKMSLDRGISRIDSYNRITLRIYNV